MFCLCGLEPIPNFALPKAQLVPVPAVADLLFLWAQEPTTNFALRRPNWCQLPPRATADLLSGPTYPEMILIANESNLPGRIRTYDRSVNSEQLYH